MSSWIDLISLLRHLPSVIIVITINTLIFQCIISKMVSIVFLLLLLTFCHGFFNKKSSFVERKGKRECHYSWSLKDVSDWDKSITTHKVRHQIRRMAAIIGTALHWSDILVLLLYFLLILGFGVWVRWIAISSCWCFDWSWLEFMQEPWQCW